MSMRIGIVGMGWVGSSIAISLLHSGLASELLLADIKPGLAEGEAMDLRQGAAFYPAADVRAASIDEIATADAVVISAGRGGRPGESRLDLLRDNARIVREIGVQLANAPGLVVVVTNPVDIMTQVVVEASGLSPSRVIGTGTMLDTARLRQVLGRELRLEPQSIHAQIVGEHGDSQVVLWSSARVGGVPLRRWRDWQPGQEAAIAAEVQTAAHEIIVRKGATNHAIGLVTAALLRWALRGSRRILTVSRVQEGALGLRDVALSLPAVVGADGATEVLQPELSPQEHESLHRSADVLRAAQARIA